MKFHHFTDHCLVLLVSIITVSVLGAVGHVASLGPSTNDVNEHLFSFPVSINLLATVDGSPSNLVHENKGKSEDFVCTPGQNTWTGLGATNNWSEIANWTCSHLPTANENVIFDATGTKNASIDISSATVQSLTITSGYTGVITAAD